MKCLFWVNQFLRLLFALSVCTITTYVIQGRFYSSLSVCLFILGMIVLQLPRLKWTWYFLSIVGSLLLPMAMITNGACFSYSTVSTVLATNVQETFGFLESLPLGLFNCALLSLIGHSLVIVLIHSFDQRTSALDLFSNKVKTIGIAFLAIACTYMSYHQVWDKVFKPIYDGFQLMRMSDMPETTWHRTGNLSSSKNYEVYVLVIGESLRRDMVSFYGNRFETTPFLNQVPKVYIADYLATAVNTSLAVPQILALPDTVSPNVREGENILALANSLGYETSWISAQGFSGKYDLTTSRIARYAQHLNFDAEQDFEMVPLFAKQLEQSAQKPQLIVLHMMGSHEYPCGMLSQWGIRFETNQGEMENCYLSSVSKTDEFLRRIIEQLKTSGKTYSLIYQSDHAQNHVKTRDGYKVFRSDKIKQTYQIPFFMIASDMKQTRLVNVQRSAFHFVEYFPTWLGVETNLTPHGYDIFNNESEQEVQVLNYQGHLQNYGSLKEGLSAQDIFK